MSGAASALSITTDQGDQCFTSGGAPANCVAVSAARSNAASITDGDASTFFSLGVANANGGPGSVTVNVSPLVFDGDIFAIEITNGNPNGNYPESAIFTFTGSSPSSTIRVDNLSAAFAGTNGLTATSSNVGNQSVLTILLGANSFDTLVITDNTFADYAASYVNRRSDGFDLGELRFATTPFNQVPAPGAMVLLGLGLLGMGAMRRRAR
nr:PEP-CTERM sorting domain-containing protein [Pacificimonas pallii]